MAVTINDLLEGSKLGESTLRRVRKSGILGTPAPRPYPPIGRGRRPFVYPDFALDVCKKIKKMLDKGYTLQEAVGEFYNERLRSTLQRLRQNIGESLDKGTIKFEDGREVKISSVYIGMILHEIKNYIKDREKLQQISHRMRKENLIDLAFIILQGGYNPVLMFNDEDMRVVPDLMVSHFLSREADERGAWIIVPLLPATKGIIQGLTGGEIKPEPKARPARKIEVKKGRDLVEYEIFITGSGFELIEWSAQVIGTKRK
jgi:hypothetical protein